MRRFATIPWNKMKVRVPVVDGKKHIIINRTEADVLLGKKADPELCMDANCANREHNKFPHRFYGAMFTSSRAYVVDKLDRVTRFPCRVVRYVHTDGDDIEKFDKGLKVTAEKMIHLYPPIGIRRLGKSHGMAGPKPTKNPGSRPQQVRGVTARYRSLAEWKQMKAVADK